MSIIEPGYTAGMARRILTSAITTLVLGGCDQALQLDLRPPPPPDGPPTYVQAVLDDNPLAYFRLGETTGVTAFNSITDGPTGTYTGALRLGVAGALDDDLALSLDGTNGAVDVGDVLDFPGLAPFSIEVWIAPEFTTHFAEIVSKWAEPPIRKGYTLYHRDGLLAFERDLDNDTVSVVEYTGLTAGVYSHVVATFDGAELALYVNGTRRGARASTLVIGEAPVDLMIGSANGDPGAAPFKGSLDEVAIYGSALSAERVYAHFTAAGRP